MKRRSFLESHRYGSHFCLSLACVLAGCGGESVPAPQDDPGAFTSRTDLGATNSEVNPSDVEDGPSWPSPDAIGPRDALAIKACSLAAAPETQIPLAGSRAEAAQVVLTPNGTRRYRLVLPPTGKGYAKLQIADWHTTVGVFARAGTTIRVEGGTATLASSRNGACPTEFTDQRWLIHEWGTYLVEIGEDGPRSAELVILDRP